MFRVLPSTASVAEKANTLEDYLEENRDICRLVLLFLYTPTIPKWTCLTNNWAVDNEAWITAFCVSPDGALIIVADQTFSLRLFDFETGKLFSPSESVQKNQHKHKIHAIKASGEFVYSGSVDTKVKVWKLYEDELIWIHTYEGHIKPVLCIDISSDNYILVTAGRDKVVRVWDTWARNAISSLEGHKNDVTQVVISADSRYVISSAWDQTVKIWGTMTGECLKTINFDSKVFKLCVANEYLFCMNRDKQLIWNLSLQKKHKSIKIKRYSWPKATACVVYKENHILYRAKKANSEEEELRVLNLQSGNVTSTCEFSADGKIAAFETSNYGQYCISAIHNNLLLKPLGEDDSSLDKDIGNELIRKKRCCIM